MQETNLEDGDEFPRLNVRLLKKFVKEHIIESIGPGRHASRRATLVEEGLLTLEYGRGRTGIYVANLLV